MLFLESFDPPEPQLSSITTKIDTEVEYYHTCVNLLVKFSHDLHYCCQEDRYVENGLN